jgi:hypothetical protein
MQTISAVILVFILVYRHEGLYPKIPALEQIHAPQTITSFELIPETAPNSAPETIAAPIPLSASEVIRTRTLQPTQHSKRIVLGTSATTKKTDLALP